MSSPELIILTVTGVIAMGTYIVKHMKTSTCWTNDSCFSVKMDNTKTPTPSVCEIKVDEKVNEKIIVSSAV